MRTQIASFFMGERKRNYLFNTLCLQSMINK
ncbi:hypothetical protein VPHF86_0303 [Vibrio phage F86]